MGGACGRWKKQSQEDWRAWDRPGLYAVRRAFSRACSHPLSTTSVGSYSNRDHRGGHIEITFGGEPWVFEAELGEAADERSSRRRIGAHGIGLVLTPFDAPSPGHVPVLCEQLRLGGFQQEP